MAIQYAVTAQRAGVSLGALTSLLDHGQVDAVVANRLGLTVGDAEAFIGGAAHANVTNWLRLPNMAAAQELANELGREGRIGFLVARLFGA
jgi:hypothetical protein